MKPYIIFDGHCDTAARILDTKQPLYQADGHLDLARMSEYRGYIQCFAAFIAPKYAAAAAWQRLYSMWEYMQTEIAQNSDKIVICTQKDDVRNAISAGKCAAVLTVEGGEALEGDLNNIEKLAKMGYRAIGLTWNHDNDLATGCLGENAAVSGLTELGRAAVAKMEEYNILPDVSHLSEKSFWDVAETAKGAFIATHSNSAAVYADPNHRNLTDDQFKAICASGGAAGINLCAAFLNSPTVTIADVIRHIEHFLELGGEDHVGLGCDFDGIDVTPEKITGMQDLPLIFEEMARLGYSDKLIEKISCRNFLRVFGFEL